MAEGSFRSSLACRILGGRGLDKISVYMCISEHTVKIIIQGMRKQSPPTCKNSLAPELNHVTYLERFQTTSPRDIRHAYTSCDVSTSKHFDQSPLRLRWTTQNHPHMQKEAAGFKNPKRMQKESAGFKNPKRLQPSHEQVWLTMD